MTPIETALLFVGAPAAIALVLAGLVYGASARKSPRYRPGRPFTFAPVWFLAAERAAALEHTTDGDHAAIEARHQDGQGQALTLAGGAETPQRKGGARGTW